MNWSNSLCRASRLSYSSRYFALYWSVSGILGRRSMKGFWREVDATMLAAFLAAALTTPLPSLAQALQDPSAQCTTDLAKKPDFAHVVDKLPLGGGREITFAMLANDAVPTVQERGEIGAFFTAWEECGKLGESFRQAHYPPEVNNQLAVSLTAMKEIGVDLYKGRVSYGDANRRFATVRDGLVTKVTEFVQQYKKDLEAQRAQTVALGAQAQDRALQASIQEREAAAQEQAQRQQRMQMMFNYLQANRVQIAPPPALQIRPSVTTNCIANGNQVNCNSQ
jgi:hypothetical protein